MMRKLLLETTGLDAAYGGVLALHQVEFQIAVGETVALLGSNGAGKSTLLKTLAGLHPASGGRISFQGQSIDALRADRRARLGLVLVPEGRRLFPDMTVLENLLVGAVGARGNETRNDLARVFALFPKLAERQSQKAGSLSGGEQQMAAIARGLMARPRLLLLDEPSLGLAPRIAREVFQAITELAAMGMSVLLAEQHVRMALHSANRGYVLRAGQVVFADTSSALLARQDLPELCWGTTSREVR